MSYVDTIKVKHHHQCSADIKEHTVTNLNHLEYYLGNLGYYQIITEVTVTFTDGGFDKVKYNTKNPWEVVGDIRSLINEAIFEMAFEEHQEELLYPQM